MLIRRILFLIIALSCQSFPSGAQADSTKVSRRRVIMGYYSDVTGVLANFSQLNNVIAQQGYAKVQDYYTGASFGLSFRNAKKKAYTSLSVAFFRSDPDPLYDINRVRDTRVNMWAIHLGNYFDLVSHPKWLVYPYFGFGAGVANLTLYDNANTQTSFSASISNLSLPVHKSWTDAFTYLDIGAGIERKISIWIYDFYAGLSGGYRLSTNARFREPYQTYSDSPSVRLRGLEFCFRLRFEIARLRGLRKNS